MSSRFGAHDTTAGGLVNFPPSHVQSSCDGSHCEPSQVFWNIEPSSPSPKMSSRFGAQDTTDGGLVNFPPSHCQSSCDGSHWEPSQVFWNIDCPRRARRCRAGSAPRTRPPAGW